MIDFIVGKIEHKGLDYVIINSNQIGYKITTSMFTIMSLELGETAKIYTDLVVREDGISLYGFSNTNERELYKLLTTVRGIGPKMGIGILSGMNTDTIIAAIRNSDINTLIQAPGVGKKTAERIILELKDKTDNLEVTGNVTIGSTVKDAEQALLQLGYSSYEVIDVLEAIYENNMTVEDLIKNALKQMTR